MDVFSNYAWCVPLKNKSAKTVMEGFKQIIEASNFRTVGAKVQADKGSEFLNKTFLSFLKSKNMHFSQPKIQKRKPRS